MATEEILQAIAANPQLLALVISLVWNLLGYVYSMLNARKLTKYEATELLKTIVLFESIFTILMTLGGVSATWTAIIAVLSAFIRSAINAIKDYTQNGS